MILPSDKKFAREAFMTETQQLIPPPPVIRDRLARAVREARLLRALLRLSIQIAEYRDDNQAPDSSHRTEGGAR